MIRAIFFDMGGTLDGDGLHWLERFLALYKAFGVDLSRESNVSSFSLVRGSPSHELLRAVRLTREDGRDLCRESFDHCRAVVGWDIRTRLSGETLPLPSGGRARRGGNADA